MHLKTPLIIFIDRSSPTISTFTRLSRRSVLTLGCVTTTAPPTSLTWTKNGRTITIDNNVYRLTQKITYRSSYTYENKLEVFDTPDNFTGTYQCTVGNNYYSYSSSSRRRSVTVRG